jgi:hypothetical protein
MEGNEANTVEEQEYRKELASQIWGDGGQGPDDDSALLEVDDSAQEQMQEEDSKPESDKDKEQPGDTMTALQTMFSTLTADLDKRLKPLEGRVGAIQRDLQLQKNAAEQAAKIVQVAPTKEQMAEASQDTAEWEQLKDDFPEWATALEKRTGAVKKELMAEIEALKGGTQQPADLDERVEKIKADFEVKLLSVKHPGWRNTTASKEYQDWLTTQPQDVQHKATSSRDAMECIEILDSFEKHKSIAPDAAEIANRRNKRLKASETTIQGRARPLQTKSEDDMTPEEYRAHVSRTIWRE